MIFAIVYRIRYAVSVDITKSWETFVDFPDVCDQILSNNFSLSEHVGEFFQFGSCCVRDINFKSYECYRTGTSEKI